MNSSAKAVLPSSVVVMGGGRWARVYVDELLQILPVSTRVLVYSPRNAKAMFDWIISKGIDDRVSVFSSLPVMNESDYTAVIIVNAAADHLKSIEWAISQNAPVLIEKPLALNSNALSVLINEATRRGVYLAAAHVFLFAEYLSNFKNKIQSLIEIESLDIVWADATKSTRHGEIKSFDPGVRVFEDCLPHVMSMLEIIQPGLSPKFVDIMLSRGGAHLNLVFSSANCRYTVCLIRNGIERRRIITVSGKGRSFSLDFTHEPGTIVNCSETISACPDWAVAQKPLSSMLSSFFEAAGGGCPDSRLATAVGMRAASLSEEILPAYYAAQAQWLVQNLFEEGDQDEGLRYALREIALSGYSQALLISEEKLSAIIKDIKSMADDPMIRHRLENRPIDFVLSLMLENA